MTEVNKKTEKSWGLLCIFLAAVCYSIGGLCIKVIPWSGMSINGARTLIAVPIVGAYIHFTHRKLHLNKSVILGAICVSGTNMLYTVANKMTTAANAIVLQFSAPIFVILLTVIFWKKKPGRRDVAACIILLAGVICFFIDSLEMGGMIGNFLALLSGVTYAGVFLLYEMPGSDPFSSVFFGGLVSVIAGLPFLVQETVFSPTVITSVLVLGVIQVAVAYLLMCIGLKNTPPVAASLVSGIEPILNPILVAIFYGEEVGMMAIVGIVIVIGDVLLYNLLPKPGGKTSN